jgi:hypothetical protein
MDEDESFCGFSSKEQKSAEEKGLRQKVVYQQEIDVSFSGLVEGEDKDQTEYINEEAMDTDKEMEDDVMEEDMIEENVIEENVMEEDVMEQRRSKIGSSNSEQPISSRRKLLVSSSTHSSSPTSSSISAPSCSSPSFHDVKRKLVNGSRMPLDMVGRVGDKNLPSAKLPKGDAVLRCFLSNLREGGEKEKGRTEGGKSKKVAAKDTKDEVKKVWILHFGRWILGKESIDAPEDRDKKIIIEDCHRKENPKNFMKTT